MKKLFVLMAAAFAMVACQTDINEVGVVAGGEVDVTFEVGTPTRAYSDGTTATVLQYAVYEGTTELEALTHSVENGKAETINISKTVSFKLVTGNEYTVIFWAAAPNAPYTVDFANKKMTVDYTAATTLSNDENRDAFFKKHTFTVTGAQTEVIELRRPFAQLNIGTNDYDEATEAGYTPINSAVTVKNIYNTLNLWDATVDGETEVDFGYAAIAKTETFPVDGYEYLAMNYLLVPADKEVVDIEFGYSEGDATVAKTRVVGSVPVQRNHRTNIYGQLLTSDVDINIEIKPAYYEPSHEADALFHAAAFGGEVTLTEDVELKAPLKVQSNMVLNLNGKTITTTEQSAGRHHYAIDNYATLVIEGEGAIDARGIENFGTLIINGNVTITNIDTNGGAAIWNEGKLTINNGTFTTNAYAGVGSYGAALNTRANGEAIVNGGTFIANSQLTYAIINAGKTTIYKANVKGKHGAVAAETASATTEIYGGSFELMENPNTSDHCTYFVSAIYGGKFSLGNNTDCGGQVFYESAIATGYKAIVKDGFHYVVADEADVVVANATDLQTALAKSETITIGLAAGEYGTIVMKSNKTIIGVEGAVVECVNLNGADNVTIKNIVFDAATAKMGYDKGGNAKQYANIITGDKTHNANKGAHNLVIEGCVFQGTFASDGVAIAFTDKSRGSGGSGNVTIKGCTFDTVNASCDIYGHYTGDGNNGHGEFIILNNVFKKASNVGGNIYLGRYASSTPVKVSGNKFAAASLEDAMYVQDHSSYGVSVDASNNTFGN